MKKYCKPAYLPLMTVIAGGIGLLLRVWLLTGGVDESGLIKPWYPAEILLWVLTAGVLGVLIWQCRRLTGANRFRYNFPASLPGAVGTWAGAAGIALVSATGLLTGGDSMHMLASLMGLLAVPVLIYLGQCRREGRPASVLFNGYVCIYLLIYLVCQYRKWSSDPQLLNYCFQLLSIVCLTLALYHRAAFDVRMGSRKMLALTHLGCLYFSLIAIPGSANWLLFLCIALWMYTGLCSLRLVRPKPAQE